MSNANVALVTDPLNQRDGKLSSSLRRANREYRRSPSQWRSRINSGALITSNNEVLVELTLDGDAYSTFDLQYDQGPRYWKAVLQEGRTDRLAEISTARRPGAPVPEQDEE